MEYLGANPDKAAYTFEYMAAHKAAAPTWMDGSVPVEDFKISDEDRQKGRAVLVDVGGGKDTTYGVCERHTLTFAPLLV